MPSYVVGCDTEVTLPSDERKRGHSGVCVRPHIVLILLAFAVLESFDQCALSYANTTHDHDIQVHLDLGI